MRSALGKAPSHPVLSFLMLRVLTLCVVLPTVARGQEPAQPASKQSQITDAKGRKVQVVDFDDANIEGKAKAPDGFVLQSRNGSSFKNIIELRRNFRQQIQGSAYEALVANPSSP